MNRREFMQFAGAEGLVLTGFDLSLDEGLLNDCLANVELPAALKNHDLVQQAWEGVPPDSFWDCHAHLIGQGDNGSGAWVNPDMKSVLHLMQYAQYRFYLNAGCVDPKDGDVDQAYIARLRALIAEFKVGAKFMLLAFDYHYNPLGVRMVEGSAFHVPNDYARKVVSMYPAEFEWIASIHPYREDCVEELEKAVAGGARAVKWLPPAMGMDPASPLCDSFYAAMARLRIPLLTHAGTEKAVHGANRQDYGNPLRLRRALEHGVRTIVAHCASLGSSVDIDKGKTANEVPNIELFGRMMDEKPYEQLLLGDISATTQINRLPGTLATLIERDDWHHRLLNGSDYPLPGVVPLFSTKALSKHGYLTANDAEILTRIRRVNPLVFDFVCKRALRYQGRRLSDTVFSTRRHFDLATETA